MISVFRTVKDGLSRTRQSFTDKLGTLILGDKVDEAFFDELEEALITSDIGARTTMEVLNDLRERFDRHVLSSPSQVRGLLKQRLLDMLAGQPSSLCLDASPSAILVVGVNGTGKTTTIGKLAARLQKEGKRVLLAAADTFRAAASEQLSLWGEKADIPVVKHHEGADPGAVVFDAVSAAKARSVDVLIVDTAGRLHTKSNLMEELKKVKRILSRELLGAPHEVLLVLDASTGQNALAQAKTFHDAVGVTGIALTKLDGTSKGGIVFAISRECSLPVKLIGIGETIEDLRNFDGREFVEALF